MPTKRKRRKYSLFSVKVVNGRKRYERLSNLALPKDSAVRFWEDALLRVGLGGLRRELRPVKD
jgi:hypothetical protein